MVSLICFSGLLKVPTKIDLSFPGLPWASRDWPRRLSAVFAGLLRGSNQIFHLVLSSVGGRVNVPPITMELDRGVTWHVQRTRQNNPFAEMKIVLVTCPGWF